MGTQSLEQGVDPEVFRPKRNLWVSAWGCFTAFTLPAAFSLYLLTVPTGRWEPVAVAHAAVIVIFVAAAWRLRGAGVSLAQDGIRERAYFSLLVFTPAEKVASVMVIQLRDSNSDDVSRQLFIVDADGHTLLRLRGQLWHSADLNRITNYFAAPVVRVDTVTWPELRRRHGRNLERWERHPFLTATTLVAAFIGVTVPALLAVMSLTGHRPL